MKTSEPNIRKRKWPYPLIWMIPVLTALGTAVYIRDYFAHKGVEIVIKFNDAVGLQEGETKVLYRGAEVGKVTLIDLSDNHRSALVHVELTKKETVFAKKGAQFWIVRPEVSEAGLTGLGTLFSGPYISALPGSGDETVNEVSGLLKAPRENEDGEKYILTTPKVGHVQNGSGVYYKGIQVGEVREIELAPEADHLNIQIFIFRKFVPLVHVKSKFWVANGFDFKAGLFSGASLRLDSMKTLISGGVTLGTPEKEMGPNAKSGTHFALEEEGKKDWEKWSPQIWIGPNGKGSEPRPVKKNAVVVPVPKKEKTEKE